MLPSEELSLIYQKQMKVVNTVANDLFSELIKVTPVDTGTLKGAWDIQKIKDGWRISNNITYADVIFEGRRLVAGKWYGSKQLQDGLDPILFKYNKILEIELNKVRV